MQEPPPVSTVRDDKQSIIPVARQVRDGETIVDETFRFYD